MITLKKIDEVVMSYFRLPETIAKKTKRERYVLARYAFYGVCAGVGFETKNIIDYWNIDRTTIYNVVKRINDLYDTSSIFKFQVNEIKKRIGA